MFRLNTHRYIGLAVLGLLGADAHARVSLSDIAAEVQQVVTRVEVVETANSVPSTIGVDCATEQVQEAVDMASPVGHLTIEISGVCNENVIVTRSGVTFKNANPAGANGPVDGIRGHSDGLGALDIRGARNIVVSGLLLQSAAGVSDSSGVRVTGNGAARVIDSLVQNAPFGVFARNGGFVQVENSTLRDISDYGLLVTDGAAARVEGSDIVVPAGAEAAIGAFRNTNVRFRLENRIEHLGGGDAVSLFHTSDIRQDGGTTTFLGALRIGNLSHASLRDPVIKGTEISVSDLSRLEIRETSSTTEPEALMSGRVRVSRNSIMDVRNNVSFTAGSLDISDNSYMSAGAIQIAGNVSVNASSRLRLRNGESNVANNFGLTRNTNVTLSDDVTLNVGGDFRSSFFAFVRLEENSTLTSGGPTVVAHNSHLLASPGSTIDGDLQAFDDSDINLFGAGITYSGNLSVFEGDNLRFGADAQIDGNIRCHGTGVSLTVNLPTFVSGGFVDCDVYFESADLAVDVNAASAALAGTDFTVGVDLVAAANAGGSDGIVLTLNLGGVGASVVSASPTGPGDCDVTSSTTVVCDLGFIGAGASNHVDLVLNAATEGSLTVEASAVLDQNDSNPSNNIDNATITITGASGGS